MLDKDIFATNVYTIGYEYDSWNNLDFTHKIQFIVDFFMMILGTDDFGDGGKNHDDFYFCPQ